MAVAINLMEPGTAQESVTALSGAEMVMTLTAPAEQQRRGLDVRGQRGYEWPGSREGLAEAAHGAAQERVCTCGEAGGVTVRRDVVVLPAQAMSGYVRQLENLGSGHRRERTVQGLCGRRG